MGLEAVAFAGRAGNEDIGEKLHRDFFVAHASATITAAAPRVK